MGHRVSSNLFRLQSLRTWNSHWFAKSEYTYLLSLDYRVRDFIDFVFYNLKWPTSELQIKRFLSRSIVLEILVSIPNDQLVLFLDYVKFFGNFSITDDVDAFKFNSLIFEFNYVLHNFVNNVLGRSIFFLILRKYKLNRNYYRSLYVYLYKSLFNIQNVPFSFLSEQLNDVLKNKNFLYYIYRKKNFFISDLVSKSFKTRFHNYKFNLLKFKRSKHYLTRLLSLFSQIYNNKLYTPKYNTYLRIISYITKLRKRRSLKAKKLYIKLLSAYKRDNYARLNKKNKYIYDTYFGNVRRSFLYLLYKYFNSNPYILLSNNNFVVQKPVDLFLQFNRSVNKYTSNKKLLIRYLLKCIHSENINYSKHLTIISSILDKSYLRNKKNSNILLLFFLFLKLIKYSKNINKAKIVLTLPGRRRWLSSYKMLFRIIDHYPVSFLLRWFNSILKRKKRNRHNYYLRSFFSYFTDRDKDQRPNSHINVKYIRGRKRYNIKGENSKYFSHLIYKQNKRKKRFNRRYTYDRLPNLSIKNQKIKYNKSSFFNNNNNYYRRSLKSKFIMRKYHNKFKNIVNYFNAKLINNLTFSNSKLLFFPVLLNHLHSFYGNENYSFGLGQRYRKHGINIHRQINLVNYLIRLNKNRKKKLKKINSKKKLFYKSVLLSDNKLKYINILYRYDNKISNSVDMFYFFKSFWYYNSSSFYVNKLLYLAKYDNFNLNSIFYNLYKDIYDIFIYKKFISFYNYLRFENSIFTVIKFLRFYKKFFLYVKTDLSKKYCRNVLSYIVFTYYYINIRFSRMQLFIRNLLNLFFNDDHSLSKSILVRDTICSYIYVYYFHNHLKIIQLILRILILCITLPYKIFSLRKPNVYFYLTKFIKFKYDKAYIYIKYLYNIQINFIISLQKYLPRLLNLKTSLNNLSNNVIYHSLIKILPGFVRHPYYILNRKTALYDLDYINGLKVPEVSFPFYSCDRNIINLGNTHGFSLAFSKQWKNLIYRRWPYFFRYVTNKLIFYLDEMYRDLIPVQALELFSNFIEYNLSVFTGNVVKFMPIFYINKRVPFYQAKLICLYITYELEKGMPYFLVLKQIIYHNRFFRKYKKKSNVKNLDNIIEQRIPTLDHKLIRFNKLEFIKKYKNEWQSKSIFKYYIIRNFYSISSSRGFKCRLGIRVSCSGRMYRRQTRSHTMWFVEGALPLRSFDRYVDYYSSSAVTRLGAIGVKVWIYLAQYDALR